MKNNNNTNSNNSEEKKLMKEIKKALCLNKLSVAVHACNIAAASLSEYLLKDREDCLGQKILLGTTALASSMCIAQSINNIKLLKSNMNDLNESMNLTE